MSQSDFNAAYPVVLVTGCSSGIGAALAKKLYLRSDLNVVVTARKCSIDKLHNLFQESKSFKIRVLDITEPQSISDLVNEIAFLWGRVDVVINNAGVCYRSVVEQMDEDSEMIQLKTNYLGPMNLIRCVLPIMREQCSGKIINISSVSGMLAMPTMGSYSASKHALEGATESLWYEAKPFNIDVHLVQIGFVNSRSFSRVILSKKAALSSKLSGPHAHYYYFMSKLIGKLMAMSFSTPEKIADKILYLVEVSSARLHVPITIDAVFFRIVKGILPSFWINKFLYFLLPKSVKTRFQDESNELKIDRNFEKDAA